MTGAGLGLLPGQMKPTRGALRVVRGAALAVPCTVVALAGHVLGGESAPSLPAVLAVAALVGAGLVVLADRRRSFAQILFAALCSQPVFHLAFSLAGHGPSDPRGVPAGREALAELSAASPSLRELLPPLDLPMVAGHVVAAGGIAWLLAYAEAVLWALLGLFARIRLPRLDPIVAAHPSTVPLGPGGTDVTPPRRQLLARLHSRRGPP